MPFEHNWTEVSPTDDTFAYDIDNWFRRLSEAIRERLAVEHNFFADETGEENVAKHKQVEFVEKDDDPAAPEGGSVIYDKSGLLYKRGKTSGVSPLTGVRVTTKTADHTLELDDDGSLVVMNKATAVTLTIPLNATVAFPIGSKIAIYQLGEGATTIEGVEGVTINKKGDGVIVGQYGLATLVKQDTNTWLLISDSDFIQEKVNAGVNNLLIVVDQKTAGTDGGTFTRDAWRTRDLNTIRHNTISGASLANNQITLPAGTYNITASVPIRVNVSSDDKNAYYRARLYNVTDAAEVDGTVSDSGRRYGKDSDTINDKNLIFGVFTLAAEKVLEIQHYVRGDQTQSFGNASTVDSKVEIYTQVVITKIS